MYYMCETCNITGVLHMYYMCMNYICNTPKHTFNAYVTQLVVSMFQLDLLHLIICLLFMRYVAVQQTLIFNMQDFRYRLPPFWTVLVSWYPHYDIDCKPRREMHP